MYTAHHDRRRCFEETLNGPFSVTVCGSWFPRSVCSRFQALCAYARCIIIAVYVAWVAWRCAALGGAPGCPPCLANVPCGERIYWHGKRPSSRPCSVS